MFTGAHTHTHTHQGYRRRGVRVNPPQSQTNPEITRHAKVHTRQGEKKWLRVRLKVTACMLRLRQQRGTEYITTKTHKRACAGGTIPHANEALAYGGS